MHGKLKENHLFAFVTFKMKASLIRTKSPSLRTTAILPPHGGNLGHLKISSLRSFKVPASTTVHAFNSAKVITPKRGYASFPDRKIVVSMTAFT